MKFLRYFFWLVKIILEIIRIVFTKFLVNLLNQRINTSKTKYSFLYSGFSRQKYMLGVDRKQAESHLAACYARNPIDLGEYQY
mgnify:CR=1 FL=1